MTGSLPAADASLHVQRRKLASAKWTLFPLPAHAPAAKTKVPALIYTLEEYGWRLQSIQQFKFNIVCHVYETAAVNFNMWNIALFWERQRRSTDMDFWNTGCESVFSKGMHYDWDCRFAV